LVNLWIEQINKLSVFRRFNERGQKTVPFGDLFDPVEEDGFTDAAQTQQHL